jgi:hypothetical protein
MWDKTGHRVSGRYMNLPDLAFVGTVTQSRVKYGGQVQHTVQLDQPLTVFGQTRETVLVNQDQVEYLDLPQ